MVQSALHVGLLPLAVLFLIGLGLLVRGLRARRIGDALHCRHCGYNLTGLASEKCPECGRLLTADAVVVGQRHRRWGMVAVGLLLVALPLALTITGLPRQLRRVNWYGFKPTLWVIADAGSADPVLAGRAYRELNKRVRNDALSPGQSAAAAKAALGELERPQPRRLLNDLHVELLDELRRRERLSESQRTRFFDNLLDLQFNVRDPSLASVGIPAELVLSGRTGQTRLWVETRTAQAVLSSEPLPEVSRGRSAFSGGGSSTRNWLVKPPGPGVHEIHTRLKVSVYEGSGLDPGQSVLLYETERTLTGRSTSLAEEPADFIKMVTDPQWEQAIRSAFTLKKVEYNRHNPDSLDLDIEIRSLPLDVAFSIAVLAGGKQVGSGTIGVTRGASTDYRTGAAGRTSGLTRVDVVFTPDPDLARRSVHLTEIWGKPIQFEDIPVGGPGASTSPNPPEHK